LFWRVVLAGCSGGLFWRDGLTSRRLNQTVNALVMSHIDEFI
jgi:hypothetical protein